MTHEHIPMNTSPIPAGQNRRPLFILLVLFAAPLAGAFWLYYGSNWRPSLRTNHGELVEPMVALPAVVLPVAPLAPLAPRAPPAQPAATPGPGATGAVFQGKWTLLVVGQGEAGCDADCRGTLIYARQTWLSLGQLTPRAQRVLLAGALCCDSAYLHREHAGLIVLDASGSSAQPLLRSIPEPWRRTIFVVDPLGNMMMRYDVRQDPKGLREDLKKLLELSHIG